jgi:hypothetical protein
MLTDYEKQTMTCRDIDLETAKVRGWMDGVNKESEFSGRDVLAILGDFGIDNSMERGAAMESANNRLASLHDLKSGKKCDPQPIGSAARRAGQTGSVPYDQGNARASISADPDR